MNQYEQNKLHLCDIFDTIVDAYVRLDEDEFDFFITEYIGNCSREPGVAIKDERLGELGSYMRDRIEFHMDGLLGR